MDRFKIRVFERLDNGKSIICNQENFYLKDGELYMFTDPSYELPIKAPKEIFFFVGCTGLKDKNGKLIYEGDVVNSFFYNGVVRFGEYEAVDQEFYSQTVYGFYVESSSEDADDGTLFSYFEITGNIHEDKPE